MGLLFNLALAEHIRGGKNAQRTDIQKTCGFLQIL